MNANTMKNQFFQGSLKVTLYLKFSKVHANYFLIYLINLYLNKKYNHHTVLLLDNY